MPLSWRDHPAEELQSALVGAVANEGQETYAYDAMRDREATAPWLIHLVNASTDRADALPPGGRRLHPRGPARRHRLDRAEQHLAGLRPGGDPQAVPAAGARAQPGRRDARGAAAHREPAHRPAARAHRDRRPGPGHAAGHGRDAADLRAQRQRRLAAGHGQRARPLRRGRPARRRGGRGLRRRQRAAGCRDRLGARRHGQGAAHRAGRPRTGSPPWRGR